MKEKNRIIVLVILISGIIAFAQEYEPPEILIDIESNIPHIFHCLGDINDDGCDDFIVKNYPPPDDWRHKVFEIYYGGSPMDREPGFVFESQYPRESNLSTWLLGRYLPDTPNLLVMLNYIYDVEIDTLRAYACEVRLLSLADSSLGEIVYAYRSEFHHGTFTGLVQPPFGSGLSKPSDFNNDGWDDLLLLTYDQENEDRNTRYATLDIHFGGTEFDTIPDWRITNFHSGGNFIQYKLATGYDFNGDDYDDMLVRATLGRDGQLDDPALTYRIYLGGSPMDTIQDLRWYWDHFEEGQMRTTTGNGWAALPDINNDGCDDWGLYHWKSRPWPQGADDGFYIFFGGEELDLEPDLEIGPYELVEANMGEIVGGDFNEDGIGDFIVTSAAGRGEGITEVYFGKTEWADHPNPDLVYHGSIFEGGYSNYNLRAVGDYNGDGAADWAMNGPTIISGWNTNDGVDDDSALPEKHSLIVQTYPNPFNDSVMISVKNRLARKLNIKIFDISGKCLVTLFTGMLSQSTHQFSYQAESAGIYLLVVEGQDFRTAGKVVCIK